MKQSKCVFNRAGLDKAMGDYSIDKLIDFFKLDYSETLSMSAGVWEGYSLEDHIRMCLNQFDRYFSRDSLPHGGSNMFFRVLMVLHDIGKPAAVKKGDKNLQHKETLKLIGPILEKLEFTEEEIKNARALLDGDPVGFYVKRGDSKKAIESIIKMAKPTNLSSEQFFSLLLIYYKCDAGSYTEDSGGKKALDHLFVFDHKNRTLNFSSDVQYKIDKLENLLLSPSRIQNL